MKKAELRKLVKEELKNVLNEGNTFDKIIGAKILSIKQERVQSDYVWFVKTDKGNFWFSGKPNISW